MNLEAPLYKYFSDNFNEDIVCWFYRGWFDGINNLPPSYVNMSTDTTQEKQPTDFFIAAAAFRGNTSNATIGEPSKKMRQAPIYFEVRMYTPRTESDLAMISLETIMDSLFMYFKEKEDEYFIYSDTENPKNKSITISGDQSQWNETTIRYNLVARYFD